MPKTFGCELCEKSYSSIYSLSNHKRLYHTLEHDDKRYKNTEDNLYHCRYCDKKYKHCSNRSAHEKTCKPIEEPVLHIAEENAKIKADNEKLKTENEKHKETIIKLQDKLLKSSNLNVSTFKKLNKTLMKQRNQTNNVNSFNTVNNTIQICNPGHEDIWPVLTEQQKIQIINAKYGSLDKLVEIIHCGEYNQFKNSVITNLNNDFAYTYDSDKGFFVTVTKDALLESIIEKREEELGIMYSEINDKTKIDENTMKTFNTFIGQLGSEEPFNYSDTIKYPNFKEYKKDCIKVLLYNHNEQITRDIASTISMREEN